jgi:hypothetical protein
VCNGKHTRSPFPKQSQTATEHPLQLVHTDVCGPIPTSSCSGGYRYFVTFTDDFSRRIAVYMLRDKTATSLAAVFGEYRRYSEQETGHTIRCVRSDNGTEYAGEFDQLLSEAGIRHETTVAYSPEQNGVAERANRTLQEAARCFLEQAGLPHEFWAFAILAAAFTRNLLTNKATGNKTPDELWSGNKPSVERLRTFGCDAFVHVPSPGRSKFDSRAIKCIFVGYARTQKAWVCWDPVEQTRYVSRDVEFHEDKFTAVSLIQREEITDSHAALKPVITTPLVAPPALPAPVRSSAVAPAPVAEQQPSVLADAPPSVIEHEHNETDTDDDSGQTSESDNASEAVELAPAQSAIRLRSGRLSRAPRDYWRTTEHSNAVMTIPPASHRQAVGAPESQHWQQAMREEHQSLIQHDTYDLVELPPGRRPLTCRWVYNIKQKADGSIERYKARLVVRGFSQTEGIDYNETFSPVAKMQSIRTLLAIVAITDMELHQMDVKTAFLHGDVKEDLYMQQPEGFVQPGKEHLVCKLKRALYGLKQAPRAWYERIDSFLVGIGFTRVQADYGVYVIRSGVMVCIISVYVDDLLLACNSVPYLTDIKRKLSGEFEMKDLGEAAYILGVRITRDRSKRLIYLDQQKYIEDVLVTFGMENCRPVATPMEHGMQLSADMSPDTDEGRALMLQYPYRSAVGSLMYAMTTTRPDLAFSVSAVSQFLANPGMKHWQAVKRVFRYLRGTTGQKLMLGGTDQVVLTGYSDADWGASKDTRKSVGAYAFLLGVGAVSWRSRRQRAVARSSMEAEYMALSQAACEAVWLRRLLEQMGFAQDQPTVLLADNQGSMALATNPVHHDRSKHIDIQHHYIREVVDDKLVMLQYCSTQDMAADVLTKSLTRDKHCKCVQMLGIQGSLSGSVGVCAVISPFASRHLISSQKEREGAQHLICPLSRDTADVAMSCTAAGIPCLA